MKFIKIGTPDGSDVHLNIDNILTIVEHEDQNDCGVYCEIKVAGDSLGSSIITQKSFSDIMSLINEPDNI